jgi:hypothetical protein
MVPLNSANVALTTWQRIANKLFYSFTSLRASSKAPMANSASLSVCAANINQGWWTPMSGITAFSISFHISVLLFVSGLSKSIRIQLTGEYSNVNIISSMPGAGIPLNELISEGQRLPVTIEECPYGVYH